MHEHSPQTENVIKSHLHNDVKVNNRFMVNARVGEKLAISELNLATKWACWL